MTNVGVTVWRRGELPFQVLAEETIVVHPRTHEVHVLNDTGSRIWALLATAQPLDRLVASLVAEFDAPPEIVRAEVEAFLGAAAAKRLVEAAAPARGQVSGEEGGDVAR